MGLAPSRAARSDRRASHREAPGHIPGKRLFALLPEEAALRERTGSCRAPGRAPGTARPGARPMIDIHTFVVLLVLGLIAAGAIDWFF